MSEGEPATAGSEPGARGDGQVDRPDGPTRVAIACQGGGSHTAFTAGVLQGLLSNWPAGYELAGLSGTSGGAVAALAAWYGLRTGDRDRAVSLVEDVWADLTADGPGDRWINQLAVWSSRVESTGVALPTLSPYMVPAARWAQRDFRRTLERHVDFDALPDLCTADAPTLVVGTVDVNGGVFETFVDEAITPEVMLATTALPDLFPAVEIHDHYHWDGLFSQNPPVHDLMSIPGEKPEELWVVQINPQVRDSEPTSLEEIADRRNELAGNLSLNQELRFIETVNEWVDRGHLPADQYVRTEVRRIEMGRAYHCSTKLDRRPDFVAELMALGREHAGSFRDALPRATVAAD